LFDGLVEFICKIQANFFPYRHIGFHRGGEEYSKRPLFNVCAGFHARWEIAEVCLPIHLGGNCGETYPKIEYHPPEIEYGPGILPKAYSRIVTRNCSQRGFVLTGRFFLSYYVTKITSALGDYGSKP
jgi:hypothetical protein